MVFFLQIAEDQSRKQFENDQIKEDIRSAEDLKMQKSHEEKVFFPYFLFYGLLLYCIKLHCIV